jgi:hypothetical protein
VLLFVSLAGIETLGGKHELHDLVQLDANSVDVTLAYFVLHKSKP